MAKNIFELFEEEKLKKQELLSSLEHRLRADKSTCFIASELYNARYDKFGNKQSDMKVLDNFCNSVFGFNFEDVITVFDNYLG